MFLRRGLDEKNIWCALPKVASGARTTKSHMIVSRCQSQFRNVFFDHYTPNAELINCAMASTRTTTVSIVSKFSFQRCSGILARRSFVQPARREQYLGHKVFRPTAASVRWHSAPASNSRVYGFDQVKELSESPSSNRILIGMSTPILNEPSVDSI